MTTQPLTSSQPLIIMPVKDSVSMTEQAIRAIVNSGYMVCIYDDYSSAETVLRLQQLQEELGIEVLALNQMTPHPSPNYRTVLVHARQRAIKEGRPLVIVESDVIIQPDTISCLTQCLQPKVGLVAAVTMDEQGNINFPYKYATSWPIHTIATHKRFSFCCTLLSLELLRALDFEQILDPSKSWYDVTISHLSIQAGLTNILMMDHPVVHHPHSSRPWKQLKYSHPLLYYFQKLIHGRDKI